MFKRVLFLVLFLKTIACFSQDTLFFKGDSIKVGRIYSLGAFGVSMEYRNGGGTDSLTSSSDELKGFLFEGRRYIYKPSDHNFGVVVLLGHEVFDGPDQKIPAYYSLAEWTITKFQFNFNFRLNHLAFFIGSGLSFNNTTLVSKVLSNYQALDSIHNYRYLSNEFVLGFQYHFLLRKSISPYINLDLNLPNFNKLGGSYLRKYEIGIGGLVNSTKGPGFFAEIGSSYFFSNGIDSNELNDGLDHFSYFFRLGIRSSISSGAGNKLILVN